MKKNQNYIPYVRNLILSALFVAVGAVLPFLTGQIKEIGDSLLPMHIPIMLCGIICGYKYGFAAGLILPILRSLTFGMPPLYPNSVWMALELATYGAVLGLLYCKFMKKQLWWLYSSLLISMLCGRVVWGIAKLVLLNVGGKAFTFTAFFVGGFADAVPGIILQLILVPFAVKLYEKYVA